MNLDDLLLKILCPTAEFSDTGKETPCNPVRPRQYTGPKLSVEGLFVVAGFDTVSKNRLQHFGRRLYIRNPERFHFLVPYLGHRQKPGEPKPGWQTPDGKPPAAKPPAPKP